MQQKWLPDNQFRTRVRRFRQKIFFASKQNEAKRDPFRMRSARSREKKHFFRFFSLHFASNFSLPTKAKLIERIFALLRFQKFFVSLCFRLISFSLRFKCENKRKKHFFRIEAKKFCFHFASKQKCWHFSLLFRFISLRSENDGSFLLPFCFILLRSENGSNFSLLFRFVFASFHFHFPSDFYVSHRCEKSEKSTVFASKRKKFRFRFASLRFEAKITAHPSSDSTYIWNANCVFFFMTNRDVIKS